MAISLITGDPTDEIPSTEYLQQWADDYDQTFPVLSDAEPVVLRYTNRPGLSLPSTTLIAPGGEVLIADGVVTDDDVVAALP